MKDAVLEVIKEAKNIIVRKQLYDDAAVFRDLERIILNDGDKMSADSLQYFLNIAQTIVHKATETKATETKKEIMETATTQKTGLNYAMVKHRMSDWLFNYAINAKQKGYIIGVSGGIDSAVCSTLCAMTGLPLTVVRMSIHQAADQADRGANHIAWLQKNFKNITVLDIDLTEVYDKEIDLLKKAGAFEGVSSDQLFLTSSNTRSRLRMVTLYGIGGAHNLLVCGTGNKVEDYGIGFFTKFGDGGIDISPIGELMKSEVYALGKELGVNQEILDARPTDGLWDDGRTDEDQIGATYDELEWAMSFCDQCSTKVVDNFVGGFETAFFSPLSDRQKNVIRIYWKRHTANAHKMIMPPICDLTSIRY